MRRKPMLIGSGGECLALSGKHEFLVSVCISVRTPIKSSHSIVKNPVEFHGEIRFSIIMSDALSEIQGCSPRFLIIRDAFCGNGRFCFCFSRSDCSFVDFEFVRIQDYLVMEGIEFI